MQPLSRLPGDIASEWGAYLDRTSPAPLGKFYLVAIRRTKPRTFEEQRIIVLVIDENGIAMPNVPVAFSYSTADPYNLTDDFQWGPPPPYRAHIVPTQGSGQIEEIQGGAVKQGGSGGVTVYILTPEYSSDVVNGMGMLADHTGLHLTFQLHREGVVPMVDRLAAIDAWIADVNSRLNALEGR